MTKPTPLKTPADKHDDEYPKPQPLPVKWGKDAEQADSENTELPNENEPPEEIPT